MTVPDSSTSTFGKLEFAFVFGPPLTYWITSLVLYIIQNVPYRLPFLPKRFYEDEETLSHGSSKEVESSSSSYVRNMNSNAIPSTFGSSKRNKMNRRISVWSVVGTVLTQHMVMATVTYLYTLYIEPLPPMRPLAVESITSKVLRFIFAMVVLDTYNYFLHRFFHENKWAYKHIHSWHHAIEAPYTFGALYNHPLEGFLMDALGGMFALILSDMDCIGAICFVNFGYLKTVLDHAGIDLAIPGFAPSRFHTIHHHYKGLHLNYQQPFFCFWDTLLESHANEDTFVKCLFTETHDENVKTQNMTNPISNSSKVREFDKIRKEEVDFHTGAKETLSGARQSDRSVSHDTITGPMTVTRPETMETSDSISNNVFSYIFGWP
eukprot:g2086.t1